MQKVFFNEKYIFLCHPDEIKDIVDESNIHPHISRQQVFDVVLNFLRNNNQRHIYFYSTKFKALLKDFISHFKLIKAAGGLVINDYGHILVIRRKDKWDLPKGKCEKGESHEKAGIREVSEECGLSIKNLKILYELKPTYHTYSEKEKPHLKKTYWYIMHYSGSEIPVPAIDEDITEVRWVNLFQLGHFAENTWPSLVDVIQQAGSLVVKNLIKNCKGSE